MNDDRQFQRYVARQGDATRTLDVAGEGSTFWVRRVPPEADGHAPAPAVEVSWRPIGHGRVLIRIDGKVRVARLVQSTPQEFLVEVGGRQIPVRVDDEISARTLFQRASAETASGPVKVNAPMPGTVVNVLVSEGDTVARGQAILVIEAMKMQNELAAPVAGTVRALGAQAGQAVDARQFLCEIVP